MPRSVKKSPQKTKPRRSKPRKTKQRRSKPRRSKPRKTKPRRSKPRKTTMFSSRGISLRGEGGDDRTKVIIWLKNNELFKQLYQNEQLGLPPMPKFEDSYEAKKLRASTGKHNSAKHEAKAFAKKMKSELETKFGKKGVKVVDLLVCLFKYMISIAVYVLAGASGYRKTFDLDRLSNLAKEVAKPLADKFKAERRTNKSLEFIPFINREYPNGWPIKPAVQTQAVNTSATNTVADAAQALTQLQMFM